MHSPLNSEQKSHHTLLMFGMKKSLTFVGLLAITGANAGAVDLTEGDFDAQVFESGKVRFSNIDLMMRRRARFF